MDASELLSELSNFQSGNEIEMNKQILLMLQVSVLYHLVSKNYDPGSMLENIQATLLEMSTIDSINVILLILVKTILRISSLHVLEVLEICEYLILRPNVNFFILEAFRASLLHWIGNPSCLTSDVVSQASKLYQLIPTCRKKETNDVVLNEIFDKYEDFIVSNREIYIGCKLLTLCISWRNRNRLYQFLKKLKSSGVNFIQSVIHLIFGLFISDFSDSEITLAAFEVICIYLDNFKEFSYLVLTLILYKLSNTVDSDVHVKLLKYLPRLASFDENFVKVISTIKVLFNSSNNALKTLAMSLMYDLWKINNKVYSYLEDMLTTPIDNDSVDKWEFHVNKAYIIKQLCEDDPQLHGKEMVAHISNILNDCSGSDGSVASAISLEAIAILCRAGVIDIETTWTTLAPKFVNDTRTQVLCSLCNIAAEMPNVMHPELHVELQKKVICEMWGFFLENENVEVKKAALNVLGEFGLESISPYFPEQLLDKNSAENVKLDLQIIPGHCWIRLLEQHSNLTCGGDFLIKLMGKEIDEYLKSVYHVTAKKEPINYSYLPVNSIVRGIADYCRLQVVKGKYKDDPIHVECMRILSQKYSKPFPPFNWTFLHELFLDPKLRAHAVDVASHQVIISGSARKLMENYIHEMATDFKNVNGALLVYKNLNSLANSIQPMILGPFFNNTLNYGKYLLKEEQNPDFLNSIVKSFKDVLSDQNVQEVAQKAIVNVINKNLDSLDLCDEFEFQMFGILSKCLVSYPENLLRNTMKLGEAKGLTTEYIERSLRIRSVLVSRAPEYFRWLNDLIELGAKNPKVNFPLLELPRIFEQQINQESCIHWTVDMLGRIEAALVDSSKENSIVLQLNILIIALVVFSGFHISLEGEFKLQHYLMLFPQATAVLMESTSWHSCCSKALECFYYLNENVRGCLPKQYQNIFGKTLQAFRQHPEFRKNNKWMKYLSSDIVFLNYL